MAWHTNDATPPDTPIWSVGVLVNFGGAKREREKEGEKLVRDGGKLKQRQDTRGLQMNSTTSNNHSRWPRPISLSVTGQADLCSDGYVLCLLPGYHLEDKLKDFLWAINKRWAGLHRNISFSLSVSLLSWGQAAIVFHAAQAVMTHECFTGRWSVGCKFTAYNWFKCINIRGVILCLRMPKNCTEILIMLANTMNTAAQGFVNFQRRLEETISNWRLKAS